MYAQSVANPRPNGRARFIAATPAETEAVAGTKWLFVGLCFYLLAQSFTVPLIPFGPSWAVWPTLPDVAVAVFVAGWVVSTRGAMVIPKANGGVVRGFLALVSICAVSYLVVTVLMANLDSLVAGGGNATDFGGFGLYHLAEFAAIFWLTSVTPLPPHRVEILRRIALLVLLIVCGGILLTYAKVVPTETFVSHLPASPGVSGPWVGYGVNWEEAGLGTIGYNHAYVAAQVCLLLAFVLHLTPNLPARALFWLLLLATVSVLLTGSRAGLLTLLVFVAIVLWKRSIVAAFLSVCLVAAAILLALVAAGSPLGSLDQEAIVERQRTALEFYEAENLSGRDVIWLAQIEYLNEDPVRWLVGGGFGAASDVTSNLGAHMLPLQVLVETGLVGLAIFAIGCGTLLRRLWSHEPYPRPLCWLSIALLAGSVSYEALYPVAAMGHFLGFYLCAVAVAMRRAYDEATVEAPASSVAGRLVGPATFPSRELSPRWRRRTWSVAEMP